MAEPEQLQSVIIALAKMQQNNCNIIDTVYMSENSYNEVRREKGRKLVIQHFTLNTNGSVCTIRIYAGSLA